MPTIPAMVSFTASTTAKAAEVNSNFNNVVSTMNTYGVFRDVASQVITKTLAFTPDASYGIDVTTGGVRVQAGGVTVTGNSTITGTLTALTGITSSGTAALANVTASGTLGVTGISTLGTTNAGALTCTTFVPSGVAQAGTQAAYKRNSSGDAGATPAIDWTNGNAQRWRLTTNATPTFANPVKGAFYVLELQQDATGGRTVTWSGATIVWPDGTTPTLTVTASRKDLVSLYCIDATGSGTYLGAVIGQNYNNTTS